MESRSGAEVVLIDTHAHYYPLSSFPEFFDAAYENMSACASGVAPGKKFTAILCLLETVGSNWCRLIRSFPDNANKDGQLGRWRVDTSYNNPFLLRIYNDDNEQLFLLPGRQLISRENIELLVLGLDEDVDGRLPAADYLAQYCAKYFVILPWGVGKWFGSRGRLVQRLIESFPKYNFALGDNSGRPEFWKNVPQFELARERGIKILAGSDPLPVKNQYKKTGSYGCMLWNKNAQHRMDDSPIVVLKKAETVIENYGVRDGIGNFLFSQIRMRLGSYKGVDPDIFKSM